MQVIGAGNDDLRIDGSGVTISRLEVPGAINIYGSNVTVKDTLADDPDRGQAIYSHSPATGTVVEDTTVRSQSAGAPVSNAILAAWSRCGA